MARLVFLLLCGVALTVGEDPRFRWYSDCGTSKYDDAGTPWNSRIIGGKEAKSHEFPWSASIRINPGTAGSDNKCGAVLIHPDWVITAAQCLKAMPHWARVVVMGVHNITTAEPSRQIREIETYYRHPMWGHDKYNDADITLIKLKKPFVIDKDVRPACAPDPSETYAGEIGQMSGWGTTDVNNWRPSDTLMWISRPIPTNADCNKSYGEKWGSVTDNMVCMGNLPEYDRDACGGDAGGPMTVKSKDGRFVVVGISSWGHYCAWGSPGVNTRISAFLDWIDENMDKHKDKTYRNRWYSECGKSKYPDAGAPWADSRIIGGIDAKPNEFPYTISLRWDPGYPDYHYCGAALVHPQFVVSLTTTCVLKPIKQVSVVVGEHKPNEESDVRKIYEIEDYWWHPDLGHEEWYDANIGIIKLKEPVTITPEVMPICAPDPHNTYAGYDGVVSGWGTIERPGGPWVLPDTLQWISVPVQANKDCNHDDVYYGTVGKNMVCAGRIPEFDRDGCDGDSGTPLAVKRDDGIFEFVGIVSWGYYCAAGKPGVYTRISGYVDWVADQIEQHG